MRHVFGTLRVLGILCIAHALMLLGADEITTIEKGGIRTIRSAADILMLYRADPMPWIASHLPNAVAGAALAFFSLPGWLILFVFGGALTLITRERL